MATIVAERPSHIGPAAPAPAVDCAGVSFPVSVTVTAAAFDPRVIAAVFAPVDVGSKRARRSHVSPAVSVVAGAQSAVAPVSRWNWPGSEPPSVIEVSVTGSLPVFVTVDVCVAVGPAAVSFGPKDSLAGEAASSVWVPVPDSATLIGAESDVTVSVAVCAPVDAGS